jgi:ABC-type multidrug transport system permease subunit
MKENLFINSAYLTLVVGILLMLLGFLIRPHEVGWFFVGFGTALLLLGLGVLLYCKLKKRRIKIVMVDTLE